MHSILLALNLVVSVVQAVVEHRDAGRRDSMGLAEYWRNEAATHMATNEHLRDRLRETTAQGQELVEMVEDLRGAEEIGEQLDDLKKDVKRLRKLLKRGVIPVDED